MSDTSLWVAVVAYAILLVVIAVAALFDENVNPRRKR